MKVITEYYKFSCLFPYQLGGKVYRTLGEAKNAYITYLSHGYRLGSCIYGCTSKDDSIALSYTPYYSDIRRFGKTALTKIGEAIKQGNYTLG